MTTFFDSNIDYSEQNTQQKQWDKQLLLNSIDALVGDVFKYQEFCTEFDLLALRTFLIYFNKNVRRSKKELRNYIIKTTWFTKNKEVLDWVSQKQVETEYFQIYRDTGSGKWILAVFPDRQKQITVKVSITKDDEPKIDSCKSVCLSSSEAGNICIFR